jgi:hypothetical protein
MTKLQKQKQIQKVRAYLDFLLECKDDYIFPINLIPDYV